MDKVLDVGLEPKHFFRRGHGIIFHAMQEMHTSGEPIDTVLLSDLLHEKGMLKAAGGSPAIADLHGLMVSGHLAKTYAHIVKDKATLRKLVQVANQIHSEAVKGERKVADLLDHAERDILAIGRDVRTQDEASDISALMESAVKQLERVVLSKGEITGLPTGIRELDNVTAGLQPGDLIIIAARPSMGKSALMLRLATHVALREKQPVALFSLEMSSGSLAQRLLASEAEVPLTKIRNGRISSSEWVDIARAAAHLSVAPLYIDENTNISLRDLRSLARRHVHEHGVKLLIVDYLQLMDSDSENQNEGLGKITKGMKQIARELCIPLIALSQLNRNVEAREDKRPMMSDLRSSGSIEQDADIVAFLYREEYYKKSKTDADNSATELIISKHRNGPVGTIDLVFRPGLAKFEDIER
jgi:replicative DNA helicase